MQGWLEAFLSSHAFFIAAAWAAAGLVTLWLILRAILDYRRQKAALAALEARGAGRRRSAQ